MVAPPPPLAIAIPAASTSSTAPADAAATTPDASTSNAPTIEYTPASGPLATSTPSFSGTGAPGATLQLQEAGTSVCTTTVRADGLWSCVTSPLTDGSHTIMAVQTDASGHTSDPSTPVTFAVDTTAPGAPTIVSPADGSAVATGAIPIQGTGEAGSQIFVSADDLGYVCAVTVGDDGTWSCLPQRPASDGSYSTTLGPLTFSDGEHTLTVSAVDVRQNRSDASSVTFSVDTHAPDAPVITDPLDGALVMDDEPLIQGTGEPGATLTVVAGGTLLCEVVVDDEGAWSCHPTQPLADGGYVVTAAQADAAGNGSAPGPPVSFTVAWGSGSEAQVTGAVIGGGGVATASSWLWLVAIVALGLAFAAMSGRRHQRA